MGKPYNQLTENDKNCILLAYNRGEDLKEIETILGLSKGSIRRVLKENNINTHRRNRYTLNEEYFDKVDTEDKAYILGLLFSDGFVGRKGESNSIILSFLEDDLYMLDIIKDKIKFTGNIRKDKNKNKYPSPKEIYVLSFSSFYMAESLRNLGMNNIKSKREIAIPNINNDLKRHFIRGYFDGDGSFGYYRNTRKHKLSDGSYKIYEYNKGKFSIILQDKFVKEFIELLPGNFHIHKSKTENMVYIEASYKESIKLIYEYLYQDSTIYLERKHSKFLKYMERLAK